jgi:hypothetical protein
MTLRRAIGALMCLIWAGGFLCALSSAARAETYLEAGYGNARILIDLSDRLMPAAGLQNLVTVSTGGPVEPLLVPVRVPERWRFSVSFAGILGYAAYQSGYRPVPQTGGDALAAIRQDGSAVLMSYQTPSGSFGAAVRVSSSGTVRLVIDHAALPRWGPRPGTGLVTGIDYVPQPAPVPLPAPGAGCGT